jgi:hypothetical protein
MASCFWAGYIGQDNLGGPNAEQLGFDVFGWTDKGRDVEPIRLLINGDRTQPGPTIEPGFLTAVAALDHPLAPPSAASRTSGRRLQLAGWITDPGNPLTARVLVNRLWLHHFGAGIVRTPNNFGFKGDAPTHPQLLDWLACELVRPTIATAGTDSSSLAWTLKRMQKLIMTSHAYRQASMHPNEEQYAEVDGANRWLWRANRRRLDAEALRDALLAVSGQLNPEIGGPSFYPRMSSEALEGLSRKQQAWSESSPDQRRRRSIYMMTMRSRILPLMTTFDFCDTTQPCDQRDVTTVPTQALALLNNEFIHEQSMATALRVLAHGGDQESQVQYAWQVVLGRRPDRDEASWAGEHLRGQQSQFEQSCDQAAETPNKPTPQQLALASLCHVLLNTNEFMYVD